MTEPHLKTAPDGVKAGKPLLIGLAPAIAVVAALIVGVVFFNEPAEKAPESASAAAARPLAGTMTDEAEIARVITAYVHSLNVGKAEEFKATLCQRVLDTIGELPDAQPLDAQEQAQIDGVAEVRVNGDSATALVTASAEGAPAIGAKTTRVQFVNENGWKLCESS